MYDSPKAAHFDAYINGKLLHHSNGAGLRMRWEFAERVESILGLRSMVGLTAADKERIDALARSLFQGTLISVRRREHGEGMEASGETEHADG